MVSLVVLVMTGYIVISAIQTHNTLEKKARNSESFQSELDPLLSRALSIVKDIGPNSNQGICKFLQPDRRISGVADVFFVLPTESSQLLNNEWDKAFNNSGWVSEPSVCSPTLYRRCFKIDSSNPNNPVNLVQEKLNLEVQLIPSSMRSSNGNPFTPLGIAANSQYNARDSGFVISVKFLKPDESSSEQNVVAHNFRLLWAGEVTCQQAGANNQTITLSVSGMGSGLSSQFLLSSSLGAPDLSNRFMNVNYVHRVRSSSELRDGLIQAIRSEEASYAFQCGEERYRCPNSGVTRSWNPSMMGRLDVRYNPRNSLVESTSIHTFNQLCFGKSESTTTCPIPQEIRNNAGISQNLSQPLFFNDSREGVRVIIEDSRSACHSICSDRPGVKYNRLTAEPNNSSSPELFRAFFRSIYTANTSIAQWDPDPKPVGCSCCYKKQCTAYGLNPTGTCQDQPSEPLDSKIPECQVDDEVTIPIAFEPTATINQNRCLVVELVPESHDLVYKTEDCSTPLPAACYFQGAVKISKQLNGNNSSASFDQSAKSCAELGRIRLPAAPFRDYLRQQANAATEYNPASLPPEVGGFYEYIDNAHVGLFFNPHSVDQKRSLVRSMESSGVQKAWVPLKTDQKGLIFPVPPESPGEFSPYINYNYRGNQTFKRDGPHSFQSGNNAMVLAHHRRWLGAIRVSANQPSANLPPLCLNQSGQLFLSQFKADTLDQADTVCRTNNGVFLPPMKSYQFTKSLTLVSPTSHDLPWPVTQNIPAAWIAYESPIQPRIKLDTSTGFIYADGTPISDEPWNMDYKICRVSQSAFQIREINSPCLDYAGTSLSLIEKWEIRFTLFKTHGVNSTYRYALVEPPPPPPPPPATEEPPTPEEGE